MEKPKVCFLVDLTIIESHHGVRRYILSLMDIISKQYDVHVFSVEQEASGGRMSWLKVYFDQVACRNNGFSGNIFVGSGKKEILANMPNVLIGSNSIDDKHEVPRLFVGSVIPCEYDMCFAAAPWVLRPGLNLPKAKKTYCIAYDAIPNFYSLARSSDRVLRDFAAEHAMGYEIADQQLDGLLAISEDSKNQCKRLGFGSRKDIRVIPPFLPAGFANLNDKFDARKSKQIILAAPFDKRKGLECLPDLINGSGADSVVIFGGVRCSVDLVRSFFESLTVSNVRWWSSVDFEKQIELYSTSKLLIFPSLHEGLGLPVLEAYACGTSVLVSDINPLNKLAKTNDVLPNAVGERRSYVEGRVSSEAVDSTELKKYANSEWGADSLLRFFQSVV